MHPVPCLSQNQTITLKATAYSQGVDVTSSVGPFNFAAVAPGVVTITPVITSSYNVVTNQATATANAPGFTQIFASASGVTSTPYQQFNNGGPAWNFFERPVRCSRLSCNWARRGPRKAVSPRSSPAREQPRR